MSEQVTIRIGKRDVVLTVGKERRLGGGVLVKLYRTWGDTWSARIETRTRIEAQFAPTPQEAFDAARRALMAELRADIRYERGRATRAPERLKREIAAMRKRRAAAMKRWKRNLERAEDVAARAKEVLR